MSRIAKKPIAIPKHVEIKIEKQKVVMKGQKGQSEYLIPEQIAVEKTDAGLKVNTTINPNELPAKDKIKLKALLGTAVANLKNTLVGMTAGFERKLLLVGVGYRAQVQGKKLNLSLGFSHPTIYDIPAGITIETPVPTEIIIRGADKQQVGQVAANIRAVRPVEPYNGKGVRYSDEIVVLKETKKK